MVKHHGGELIDLLAFALGIRDCDALAFDLDGSLIVQARERVVERQHVYVRKSALEVCPRATSIVGVEDRDDDLRVNFAVMFGPICGS